MFDTITDIPLSAASKKVIAIAKSIAREHIHLMVEGPHLLKALLHKDIELEKKLWQNDYDVYYIDEWADVRMEGCRKSPAPKEDIPVAEELTALLDEADSLRLQVNETQIAPIHLLMALSIPGVVFSYEQLKSFPLQKDRLLEQYVDHSALQNLVSEKNKEGLAFFPEIQSKQALLKFCHDKTQQAAEGKTDPIVGREQEIRMMAEILSRRFKPNVLITGESGVGKSTLIDGLASAIHKQEVPDFLKNAKIFELDNGALIAGASYKGEVEERLKSIFKEISSFDKAILFIDELHILLDKQGAAGGAAQLLKPELARGTITVIGITTPEEYRKHIEKDPAFARRFELLHVSEPDDTTTFRMLKAVIPGYEKHHRLFASDDTLKETIRLARRYIKEKRLPDAAIDLADRTMSALRLAIDTGEQTVNTFRTQFEKLKNKKPVANTEEFYWHYTKLKNAIGPIWWVGLSQEEDLMQDVNTKEWINLLNQLYQRLEKLVPQKRTEVLKLDIATIVAAKTGIPIGRLQSQEKERLLNMPGILTQRVIGQNYAIAAISEAILETRSGLSKPGQPIGSFFFLGPTGTGKTELAKTLAEFMFQDERFMIRFDMSEFKEEHAAALLYGAPPGYVGYEEGGLLVNKIRQQPYAVVLFDEIEKAHASVFDIFLQIMDEGKLHDKLGREGDFSNAVVIFTSNIASQHINEAYAKNEILTHAALMELMSKYFRPEFLGRLTEIIPFAPMNLDMVENIFHIQMKGLHELLKKQGIELNVSPSAARCIAEMGFLPAYGARPLAGAIRSMIRRPLSRKIINGTLKPGSIIQLDTDKKKQLTWIE